MPSRGSPNPNPSPSPNPNPNPNPNLAEQGQPALESLGTLAHLHLQPAPLEAQLAGQCGVDVQHLQLLEDDEDAAQQRTVGSLLVRVRVRVRVSVRARIRVRGRGRARARVTWRAMGAKPCHSRSMSSGSPG